MKKVLCVATMLAPLVGCGPLPASQSNTLLTALTNLSNTGTGDLNSAVAVANAATPPDTDGVNCAQAGLTVVQSMQKELNALPAGSTVGVFTVAEVASLYAPGSAQANDVVKKLETGCIAKLHDINQTGASAVGVFATIGQVVAAGL